MRNGLEQECSEILAVCKKYGYGNVMSWASALWRYDFKRKGYLTDACFVPTIPSFIKNDCRFDGEQKKYDILVENNINQRS